MEGAKGELEEEWRKRLLMAVANASVAQAPGYATMEAVEARAQQEDDADDVERLRLWKLWKLWKLEHRKNRLKKKYFDDAFDKLPDHAKELMLEVGKEQRRNPRKSQIINTMFEKDGRAK